ncbi:hypothetical protein ABZ741_12765 [Streptomyces globisporus]|uniref:Integrase n=1 Tax=Streptomyces salyersiae TaxID=3075530 RepID=A0ABU2RI59_9ACTN|nr:MULTISPECIES: hypothetical protein [Streptomyces]MDT0427169.1 hypothetical protein [Streptomyces sp. DSM 41770]
MSSPAVPARSQAGVVPIPPELAARSPFAGVDIAEKIGLAMLPGSHRPWFEQDVWDMTGMADAPKSMKPYYKVWRFNRVDDPRWRLVAKEFILARMCPLDERVAALPFAIRTAMSPASTSQVADRTAAWLNFLTDAGVSALGDVTQDHCDAFKAAHRRRKGGKGRPASGDVAPGTLSNLVRPIQNLALYGELFTADRYAEGFLPWQGRPASQVAEATRQVGNVSPPVPDALMQPVLSAALYTVFTLGPKVAEAVDELRAHRAAVAKMPTIVTLTGEAARMLLEGLERHEREEVPLPRMPTYAVTRRLKSGWDPDDPVLEVNTERLLQYTVGVHSFPHPVMELIKPAVARVAEKVGTIYEHGPRAELIPRCDDPSVAVPWTLPLQEMELRTLARIIQAACMVVVAALSGMRASELAEIGSASCPPPTHISSGRIRYKIASKVIKKRRWGGEPDEWVVLEEAYKAAELNLRLGGERIGKAPFGTTSFSFADLFEKFKTFVNGPEGRRLGLPHIPPGPVTNRGVRRTLAIAVAYRPGGLLAAKVQLKQVHAATTEGYAHRPGGAQGLFMAEVAELERDRQMRLAKAAWHDYKEGRMPAGPGAPTLIAAFEHIDAQLAQTPPGPAHVLDADQQLINLLRPHAERLHLGVANYCWFRDPAKALCLRLAGTAIKPDSKPLISMCDAARCPQATHHREHRAVWLSSADSSRKLLTILPRSHKDARARIQMDIDRSQRVVDAIDAAHTV